MAQSSSRANQSSCELQRDPEKRDAAKRATAPLKALLPPGISEPALRALLTLKVKHLDDLAKISETQLRELHGMGPKALGILSAALKKHGKTFLR